MFLYHSMNTLWNKANLDYNILMKQNQSNYQAGNKSQYWYLTNWS